MLYNEMACVPDALSFLEKGRIQINLTGEEAELGNNLNNTSMAYLQNNDLVQAEAYAKQAETIFRKFENFLGLAQVWTNLGAIYREQQKWTDAIHYLDASLKANRDLNNWDIEGLHRLVNHCIDVTDYTGGLEWAQRLLTLDEFDEVGHSQMMRLLALSGQRGAALAQYDTYQHKLQAEFGSEPLTEIRTLYEQIQQGDLSRLEPALFRTVLPDIPFQAPNLPSYFVGREAEANRLRLGLSQQPRPRIQALVGMGGVGKTTLAAYMAHHLRQNFADGVLWANVTVSSPMDILVAWASAYNHDFSGLSDLESRAAAVRNLLADKQTLLIIDNVTGSKDVRALLPGGQQCATLLTTRDLDAAHALDAEALLLGELSPENARRLLVCILGEARVAQEEEAAREICDLLQNLPLVVEIAGQRLKSRARQRLSQMATWLREMKNRLGLHISDQAIRTSFEVSWEALDEDLQEIFPLLAVFEGRPFAAEAVAYLADADVFEIEDQLYTLTALSLLTEEGESHFRQHPLLADFARVKLGDEAEAVYSRMSDYYLTFARDNQQNYEALRPEWENMLTAIEAAYEQNRRRLALDYTDTLAVPWFSQARHDDARRAYPWSREAARQLGDERSLVATLLRWGKTCAEQSDYDGAKRHFQNSLTHYDNLDDKAGRAESLYWLACIAHELDDYDEAKRLFVDSLKIRAQLGDLAGIAAVLIEQARIYYALNAYDEPRRH